MITHFEGIMDSFQRRVHFFRDFVVLSSVLPIHDEQSSSRKLPQVFRILKISEEMMTR